MPDADEAEPATITAVGVVVPAHNEAELVGQCLESLAVAASRLSLPVQVVVVLDRCTDGTAEAADSYRAHNVCAVPTAAPGVGAARATGCRSLIEGFGTGAGLWLTTTDADSQVPVDWLERQLAHAADGADAVVGTVRLTGWSALTPHVRRRYAAGYRHRLGHRHVHGANLGFRAGSYQRAGGFQPVTHDEDVQLVRDLQACGCRIVRAADLPVTTSSRLRGRAHHGLADYLARLHAPWEEAGSAVDCAAIR